MKTTWLVISMLSIMLASCASSSSNGAAPTAAASSGQCEVAGTWVGPVPDGMLMGQILTMVFSENHTAQGTCQRVTLNSTWQRNGNQIEVIGVSADPPFANCDPTLVGRYTLEFSADCQSVTAITGDDGCNHRRLALYGFQASRR